MKTLRTRRVWKGSLPIHLIFITSIIFQACVSNKHTVMVPCKEYIDLSTELLVMPISKISETNSINLYEKIQTKLKEKGVSSSYLPTSEWILATRGITIDSDSLFQKLASANIKQVLIVNISNISDPGIRYNYFTAQERFSGVARYGGVTRERMEKETSVIFTLISTASEEIIYQSTTKTVVSPIIISEQDDDEHHINFGSVNANLLKGVKKATSEMLRKCTMIN